MAKYIKSYSNYVLKTKHQNTNDGTIFERDITTIGGRDQFSKGQVPIYRSGNFVITTNNEYTNYKKNSDRDWYKNNNGEIWTLNALKNVDKDEKSSYDKKIVVKKDFYDIRDFAYYGSCSELIRTSIENIIKTYPGELFIPYETIYSGNSGIQYTEEAAKLQFGDGAYNKVNVGILGYYTSFENRKSIETTDSCGNVVTINTISLIDDLTDDEQAGLEDGKPYVRQFKYLTDKYGKQTDEKILYLIDNPFNINIHDSSVKEGDDPLKYFANGGIDNYVAYIMEDNETEWHIDKSHEYSIEITDISYDGFEGDSQEYTSFDADDIHKGSCDTEITVNITAFSTDNTETGETVFNVSTTSTEPCVSSLNVSVSSYSATSEGDSSVFTVKDTHTGECDNKIDVEINAYDDISDVFNCNKECIQPGKYIGRITLCFKQTNNVFNVIPKRPKTLNFDATGGEGKYGEGPSYETHPIIDSYETADCSKSLVVYMFMGNNGEIKYFVDNNESNFKIRIRPKESIINEYFENLSQFEKVLLNRDSSPLYTASLELINDDDYGYYTYTKQFTFPTTYGGYNLGSKSYSYETYLKSLVDVGEYYDSLFTDNLWRSMTHESIKNFDWTRRREYDKDDNIQFVEGGEKIQKIIRLYGREFDEIKSYINGVDDLNTITYDNINNVPDYFLTDKLEDDGWDVRLIQPLKLSEFVNDITTMPVDINSLFTNKYDANGNIISTAEAEKLNYFYDNTGATKNKITIQRTFSQSTDEYTVKPYYRESYEDISYTKCGHEIKLFYDDKNYTYSDVNNEFMRILSLNSKEILRHKGTIEGIEMMLSLFGLRSKNKVFKDDKYFKSDASCKNLNFTNNGAAYYKNYTNKLCELYDYDIKEYTMFTTKEEDEWLPEKNMYKLDWVNSTKLISYNTLDYKNGIYVPYQGLPLSYTENGSFELSGKKYYINFTSGYVSRGCDRYTINGSSFTIMDTEYNIVDGYVVDNGGNKYEIAKKRNLYPHFESYGIYDGNPYYQMNGGWLQKSPFAFDSKNNIIPDSIFTETIKNIKCVQTLKELLSDSSLAAFNGEIVQVIDLSGRYAVIDGTLYTLYTERNDKDLNDGNLFFYATIQNNTLSVGNAFFTDYVIVSNPYYENNKQRIDLANDYYNDKQIKIYILKNDDDTYDVDVYSSESSISTFTVFENGKYMDGDNYTNYFKINDVDFYNELSVLGWQQLKNDEYEYYKMNASVDYREGNNPHIGNMNYDNGHEYLKYFRNPFKYATENDLIDYRKYNENDFEYLDSVASMGFKNLIDDDDCIKDYDKYLREDDKCHYFGTIHSKTDESGNDDRQNVSCFVKRKAASSDYCYTISNIYRKNIINVNNSNATLSALTYGNVYAEIGEEGSYDQSKIDSVTDQIVNTKRMEIEFYIKNKKEYSKEWLEEVKYLDSIVLPYLSQMIPSTVICRIKYVTKNKETW